MAYADPTIISAVQLQPGGKVLALGSGATLGADSGATVDLSTATVKLPTASLGTGILTLPIHAARQISANDTMVAASAGGLLCNNSTPKLIRNNTTTDKGLQIIWAASDNTEITMGSVVYPPDADVSQNMTLKILCAMNGATDTPVIKANIFEGVGGTDIGGNTTAAAASPAGVVTLNVVPGGTGYPNVASLSLTPGNHTTNTLSIYGVWIEFKKKTS